MLQLVCGNAIAEIGEIFFCGNAITENGRKKKLWSPKSGEELKKKKVLRPQYFKNIFTTKHK